MGTESMTTHIPYPREIMDRALSKAYDRMIREQEAAERRDNQRLMDRHRKALPPETDQPTKTLEQQRQLWK